MWCEQTGNTCKPLEEIRVCSTENKEGKKEKKIFPTIKVAFTQGGKH